MFCVKVISLLREVLLSAQGKQILERKVHLVASEISVMFWFISRQVAAIKIHITRELLLLHGIVCY